MFYIYRVLFIFSVLSMISFYPTLSGMREEHQTYRGGDQFHRNVGGPNYYHKDTGVGGQHQYYHPESYQRGVNQGMMEGAAAGSGGTTNYYYSNPQQQPQSTPTAPYQLAPSSSYN